MYLPAPSLNGGATWVPLRNWKHILHEFIGEAELLLSTKDLYIVETPSNLLLRTLSIWHPMSQPQTVLFAFCLKTCVFFPNLLCIHL